MKQYRTKAFDIDIRDSENDSTLCTLSISLVLFIDESKYKIVSRSVEFNLAYSSFNGFTPSGFCEYWCSSSRCCLKSFLSYFVDRFKSVEHYVFRGREDALIIPFSSLLDILTEICNRFVALGKTFEAYKYSSTIGKHLVEYGYLLGSGGRITTFDRLKNIEL